MTDITGGCQCGAVRYTVAEAPCVIYACHCRECQKQSTSGFGLSMPVAATTVTIFGELAFWERPTDSGARTRCAFCPACGTRIYHQPGSAPEKITIKAGTLDDTARIRPIAHLWVSRKQHWVMLDPAVPCHETQPDDLRAWRSALIEERNGKG